MYPIIMAGGTGTRLWPVSRKNNPKQVQPFIDNDTLLQKTYKRLLGGFSAEKIYITTSRGLRGSILEQLPLFPEDNFSLEPCRRGTASALGLALTKIWHRDKNAIFVYINSDNYIKNEQEFLRLLNTSEKIIKENPDQVLMLGIKAEYPEIGYGYIKIGENFNTKVDLRVEKDAVYKVDKFVEKPDLETAKKFISSGQYLWNATLIVSKASHFLNLFKEHQPETYNYLMEIERCIDTPYEEDAIARVFSLTTDLAIDYAITEKEDRMLVMPADIGWSDVGHWRAVKEILSNKNENVLKGNCVDIDGKNNLIYTSDKKLVGTIGLENMIIIETEDALLVCPKDRAQDVKKIVAQIKEKKLEKFL